MSSKTPDIQLSNVDNTSSVSIPLKLIDIHSKTCEECNKRRKFMKTLYKLPMNPNIHTNEIIARDEMFDEMIEQCNACFKKEFNL